MPLRVQPQPRRLYQTNPLKLVICQIRHPVSPRFEEAGFIAPFQEVLGDRYPRVSQEQQVTINIPPGAPITAPSSTALWRFQDGEGLWSVVAARDFVSLETSAYRAFEEFEAQLEHVLEATAQIGVTYRERLGVRYINEIHHPDAQTPTTWRPFINAELLGMVGGEVLGDDVIVALQDIRLREPDGVAVLRHGYVGPEASADQEPFYLLDIDFADEQHGKLDRTQTLSQVNAFHERIKNVFETSVTDALRDHLVIEEEFDVA